MGLMPYIERAFAGDILSPPPFECDPVKTVKKGKKRWIQSHMYPVKGENGEILNVIMVHEDITEHKRVEEALKKAQHELELHVMERTAELARVNVSLNDEIAERKRVEEEITKYASQLEASNKELEAFTYSASHDLRAPLRAIDSFSKIVLEDYSDKLDTEGKRQLNIIRNNTEKMSQLIDDLLKFSRLGKHEIRLSEIDIQKLAEEVFKELKAATPERKLQLKMKKLPNSRGDKSMIREVYVNLLDNAIKFTRPRETAVIEVGGRVEDNKCIYYVKDNGVGFNMKHVDKLFGVFQRLHSTEEFEGTGVGLAIIQRIIHRHGGRVWAESEVNEGTTLYFTLPSAE